MQITIKTRGQSIVVGQRATDRPTDCLHMATRSIIRAVPLNTCQYNYLPTSLCVNCSAQAIIDYQTHICTRLDHCQCESSGYQANAARTDHLHSIHDWTTMAA